jgi:predicted N-acetyltransferase YhbS
MAELRRSPTQIRVMTESDIAAAMCLKDQEGWNQTAADWERFLNASPDGSFVAESDGQVCGTVTTMVYEQRFAWIGMVIVSSAVRGQGLGTRLLEKAIEHLDARRIPTLKLDATPQGKPVYERLGFVPEYEIDRWALRRQSAPTDSETIVPADLSEIFKLDREAFGADRSKLLESLDGHAPEFTLALRMGGSIQGYAFGRRGSRADHLGPWLAQNQSAGQELLTQFLRRSTRDTVFVDCLKANPFASELLRSRGFEFSRPLTRMFRGPNLFPGRPELFCSILGPEFG